MRWPTLNQGTFTIATAVLGARRPLTGHRRSPFAEDVVDVYFRRCPKQLRPMLESSEPAVPCRIKRDTPQVEPLRLTSEPIPHHTRDMFGR
jgi:hypothetical protein